jgi:Fur family ferric uptake transcriptional regulator/Fur family peroxide stress response transcriptional regulator
MRTKSEAINRLLEFGVKPSLQRIAILDYLMNHMTHPTAEMIFNDLYPSMPTLSKTTVYNTLKLLEEQGALCAISIDEKNIRYDADIVQHAHFKCKQCGAIHDIQTKGVEALVITNSDHLLITDCQVYYKGYCEKCREEKKEHTHKHRILTV